MIPADRRRGRRAWFGRRGRGWALALFICLVSLPGTVIWAQTPPGVTVSVALDQAQYHLGVDPIKFAVTLKNVSGDTVLAGDGLTSEPLALLLTFLDPDGQPIIADQQTLQTNDPPPPRVLTVEDAGGLVDLVQVDPLESLAPTFVQSVTVADARTLYTALNPPDAPAGYYRVTCTVPVRTYAAIYRTVSGVDYAQLDTATFGGVITCPTTTFALFADKDGDDYYFPVPNPAGPNDVPDCDDDNSEIHPGATEIPGDGVDNDCDPSTSDVVTIPPGILAVDADLYTVGPGSSPSTSKGALENLPVHVYDQAALMSCAPESGLGFQHWKSIWLSCASAVLASGVTDVKGELDLSVGPGDYLVLGQHLVPNNDDELYLGNVVDNLTSGKTKQVKLKMIITATNMTIIPGKSKKFSGSELWIIEPEYVEWDSDQEFYPFIFESDGEWTVLTTVTPPEGFVADSDSLTTNVDTDLQAAQFTITDVGSEWVDTGVSYDLTHTDKDNKIKKHKYKSQVGIKLSKRLAKSKNLTRWGKGQGGQQGQGGKK